jgi:hypothetical protein
MPLLQPVRPTARELFTLVSLGLALANCLVHKHLKALLP